MTRKVRLSDIAERLNLTKVSVSKALRDHPDISKDTRELVKKTAAEMGYSPNLLARSLSSQQSLTLGVVVPKIAHTFFASAIDAIQSEATGAGYGIVLAVSNENAELERRHIERLLAMRVDGLLVSTSQQKPDLDIYERVRTMGVPLVFFDRRIEEVPFSSVTVDDYGGAYEAVEYLVRQGCRAIAHIAGTPDVAIGRRRREGYEAALRAHGIERRAPWVIEGGFDEWHGYRAFQAMLRDGGPLPEAVLAVSFPVGLGVHAAMLEHDPALQDRVRIVAFGEGGLNEWYTYPHTCVRQPTRAIGQEAVRLLLEHINGTGGAPPRHVVLPTELLTPETYPRPFQPDEPPHRTD